MSPTKSDKGRNSINLPFESFGTLRRRLRPKPPELDWNNALHLPHERLAFVYQRLSKTEQVKNSIYSLQAQDALEDLAIEDGYVADFGLEERKALRESLDYSGWYKNGDIVVEQRDLGISGTKGQEERPGLAHLIRLIEENRVEAVYVVQISRLYRDQTLINAFSFAELCKKHDVKIIAPYIRLNLRLPMHMEYYRREADWAAKELEMMQGRLIGARDLKGRQGRYAGNSIPRGYVLDTRKKVVVDGVEAENPNFEKYQVYEPHARVVRVIFERLSMPGATPTQVVRYCHDKDIRFEPLPPELAQVKANTKAFCRSRPDPDGSWPVTSPIVTSIATNPAYIGWWIWSGELTSTANHPAIIDEATFRTVQANLGSQTSRPKKNHPPLPLAGLLYCGLHDEPRRVIYDNQPAHPNYQCVDRTTRQLCRSFMAHILHDPICDFVLSQFSHPELTEAVLNRLEREYDEARERAEAAKREIARLNQEIGNLEHNYRVLKLTPERAAKLEADIAELMAHKRRLADLGAYDAGKVARAISQEEIGFVRTVLTDLRTIWADQTDDLRNAFLRLVLDRIIIYPDQSIIRAVVRWRTGVEHVIEIRHPYVDNRRPWTAEENDLVRAFYNESRVVLLEKLPNRSWGAIKRQAWKLGVAKGIRTGKEERSGQRVRRWSLEDDEVIRQVARGEVYLADAMEVLDRTEQAIRKRAQRLGLSLKAPATWTLLETRDLSKKTVQQGTQRPTGRARRRGLAAPVGNGRAGNE
jgi:DNA invertase Pin-like site-specific DNA recombinase